MKLSTDSYKGVRDFYPEDMAIQNQIFDIWRGVAEKYGYQEYTASVLESADLYRAKSGEEIVNEQTYTFKDRGNREVTLRPEMTPTVARMVAGKKRELAFPLRWFSIPNLFRYEQPQRGRLREHWQLNVDIFGVDNLQAEVEIIQMAYDITLGYGLKPTDFEVRINNRKLMNYITRDVFKLDEEKAKKLSKLIDKNEKLPKDTFELLAQEILNDKSQQFLTLINSSNFEEFTTILQQTKEEHEGLREIKSVIESLEKLGITNARFDQTLMRGFDYYTGIVFEVFDKNPLNRRSVFGGGRYDDLLSLFGGDKVPAFGFGAGDVVARDLMETYGKIDKNNEPSSADIYLCLLSKDVAEFAQDLAQDIRNKGKRVAIDFSFRKIGDQIKNADKMNIPDIICIGEEEVKTGKLKIKNLKTGNEEDYV
jgi:histidyl-tRNA synthetase